MTGQSARALGMRRRGRRHAPGRSCHSGRQPARLPSQRLGGPCPVLQEPSRWKLGEFLVRWNAACAPQVRPHHGRPACSTKWWSVWDRGNCCLGGAGHCRDYSLTDCRPWAKLIVLRERRARTACGYRKNMNPETRPFWGELKIAGLANYKLESTEPEV